MQPTKDTRAGRCATAGCKNTATERITYSYRGVLTPDTDEVCTECAESYSRRPVLKGFTRTPLGA